MSEESEFKAGLARVKASIAILNANQQAQQQQQHNYGTYLRNLGTQQAQSHYLAAQQGLNLQMQGNYGYWTASQAFQGNPTNSSGSANAGAPAILPYPATNAIFAGSPGHAAFVASLGAPTPTCEPAPKPIEDAGIRPGEVIGYRVWKIAGYEGGLATHRTTMPHGFLTSTVMDDHVWVPGEPMEGGDHFEPHCGGVHAWKSIDKAICMYPTPGYVFGSVELWGDIVEHERGYRAEFGQIKSLDGITDGDTELLARLRKRYNVGGRDDLSFDPPKRHSYGNMQAAGTVNTNPYGNTYQPVFDHSIATKPPTGEGFVPWGVFAIGAIFITLLIFSFFAFH